MEAEHRSLVEKSLMEEINELKKKAGTGTVQTLYLETLNELTRIDCRMEAEHRSPVEKSLMKEINELKKKAGTGT